MICPLYIHTLYLPWSVNVILFLLVNIEAPLNINNYTLYSFLLYFIYRFLSAILNIPWIKPYHVIVIISNIPLYLSWSKPYYAIDKFLYEHTNICLLKLPWIWQNVYVSDSSECTKWVNDPMNSMPNLCEDHILIKVLQLEVGKRVSPWRLTFGIVVLFPVITTTCSTLNILHDP